jgi:regulator of protease activity HflC (stomatin/prohibitin superfamily)
MEKRKAAAAVFMEQNAQQIAPAEAPAMDQLAASTDYGAPGAPPPQSPQRSQRHTSSALKTSEELQIEKEPIRVRETGFWLFRQIVVPPNAYVVHTRMGRDKPVTLGLGRSFRYNAFTDSYLVVPAAMQTIGVVANCISKEKQGINVLAYVQWQIADFSIAYRKLDFSDSRDPLGIVNAQLREQAEAAIKDKIATMGVEEVLTDKEPIIEELTTRLKVVAEGRGQGADSEGLGIKIVTVQLKEAFVSSQRLWENLQAPFRHEQAKTARISELTAQDSVHQKELETRQLAETREAETRVTIERAQQTKETEALELRVAQETLRFTREQESEREKLALSEQTTLAQRESEQRLQLQAAAARQELELERLRRAQAEALEKARLDAEAQIRQKTLEVERAMQALAEAARLAERQLQADQEQVARDRALKREQAELARQVQEQEAELRRQQLEAELARRREEAEARLALEDAAHQARTTQAERDAGIARLQQEVRNSVNEHALTAQMVEQLPALAEHMPEIHELKVLQTGPDAGGFDALSNFVARLMALAQSVGVQLPGTAGDETSSS